MANWLFVLPWEIHFAGGVNVVVRSLAEQAKANGDAPYLLVQDWKYKNPVHSENDIIPTTRLRMREPGISPASVIKYILTLPKIFYTLRRIVRIYDIGAINIHYPRAASLTFLLMRRLRLFNGKVIISLHGTEIRGALALTGAARAVWKLMLRWADRIVVVSDSLRQITMQLHSGNNITLIRNGVDLMLVEKIGRQTAPPPSQRPYILTVGAFNPVKGYDILLHAFSSIAADHPEIDLVIIGRSGRSKAETEALATELNLGRQVTLRYDMEHAEVLYYMRHAILFVLSSRNESFPLTILEAGAMGIPVVATDVGGVREIICDNDLGVVVCSEDPHALGKALAAMLKDESRRKILAANLQSRVTTMFSWEDAYRGYQKILPANS